MKAGPALLTVARGEPLHLPSPNVDRFVEEAVEHRVGQLVRQALEGGRLTTPNAEPLRAALVAEEMRVSHHQAAFERTARRAVAALTDVGCPIMVMKGWWAMHALHDRPTDRVTSDLDLWIGPGWPDRRGEIRTALGSRDGGTSRPSTAWSFHFEGLDVDLHRFPTSLPLPIPTATIERVWDDHTIDGGSTWGGARAPSIELALTQALVNYGKDRFMYLFQMEDVRRLMTDQRLDWERFDQLTRLLRVQRLTSAGLHAVGRTLGCPGPGTDRPSPLLWPWTGRRVVLGGDRPPLGPVHLEALGLLTNGSLATAAAALGRRTLPRPADLDPYLDANDLDRRPGYVRNLAALTRRRVGRLVGVGGRPAP